ncbi:MAG: indole-3-glycerol phosphate synthase TrpC [Verrucomicrobia bacterium]|nr:indole-3-glycerol phosphate synthase TrpC [Verrucomicrobiota bacterium]
MSGYLEAIIVRKKEEVKGLQQPKRFEEVLRGEHLTVIAEIKRKSPSKGSLAPIIDPVALARQYIEAGAQALSILTDEVGFGGSLADLQEVANAFPAIPILRKDFIVDIRQIKQTARSGATAVLLIVAALQEKLAEFIQEAKRYQLDPVVEVHDLKELELAVKSGATIIGVNNRNLSSFHVDLETSVQLSAHIPQNCIKIAESGIRSAGDGQKMRQAGFDAVLVGEALVTAQEPKKLIQELNRCR